VDRGAIRLLDTRRGVAGGDIVVDGYAAARQALDLAVWGEGDFYVLIGARLKPTSLREIRGGPDPAGLGVPHLLRDAIG